MSEKQRLLLHSCCGPCSTAVVERLSDDYAITLFFFNPNITDTDEYEKRKAAQLQFIKRYNEDKPSGTPIEFMEGPYDTKGFYQRIKGLESEPEGGSRCIECIRFRLSKTAEQACDLGFDCFGTTLSVSPHKNYTQISQIGRGLTDCRDLTFLDMDFKRRLAFRDPYNYHVNTNSIGRTTADVNIQNRKGKEVYRWQVN